MKRFILSGLLVITAFAAFSQESTYAKINGQFSSYTKTQYSVTSKFGDYFRTIETKDVYAFDSSGLKTETATYNAKDELLSKVNYKYDVSRNLISQVYTDQAGNVSFKTTYEYNADGTLKAENDYDVSDNLISKTIYKYEGSKTTENFYDDAGKLLSRTITSYNGDKVSEVVKYYGDGTLNEKVIYAYNDSGKISQIDSYDELDELVSKAIFKYDANNVLTEIQTYNVRNVLVQRDIYKNDAQGNPTRISVYDIAQKFGTTVNELQSISEYTYKK